MNKSSDSDAALEPFPAALRVMPGVAAAFATAVSVLALIGWLTATELLKRVFPGLFRATRSKPGFAALQLSELGLCIR